MATKVRIMKLLQEIRGFADVTQRRPPPKQPGLFLVQLRSHSFTKEPQRKRTISVDMLDRPDIPDPVKIKYVQPGTGTISVPMC
ncbi:MAG TPA: hypothetical protein VLT36_09485 [Candidatus Dormibacteraeota bacterium]|nr:hypothetical protein [Candidatus Dormibacteraeota bacterium]